MKTFVLNGKIDDLDFWEDDIIEVCLEFYEKYQRFPNAIRMKEKLLDEIFEIMEKRKQGELETEGFICVEADEENLVEIEFNDDEECYPLYFGPNDDCTVSFVTNKFELKFLEGEDQTENCFEVRFGDLPDFDGGEDIFEEDNEFNYVLKAA